MKQLFLFIVLLVMVAGAFFAHSQGQTAKDWNPNVRLLDVAAKFDPKGEGLAHDVKSFYESLRDKRWHDTFEGRAKIFRNDTFEKDYLAEAKQHNSWGLVNYEVLSLEFQNPDVAVLICKFTELPDYKDAYSTVYWHKEDGVWKCLSAGPKKLSIFNGTRSATVDWK